MLDCFLWPLLCLAVDLCVFGGVALLREEIEVLQRAILRGHWATNTANCVSILVDIQIRCINKCISCLTAEILIWTWANEQNCYIFIVVRTNGSLRHRNLVWPGLWATLYYFMQCYRKLLYVKWVFDIRYVVS